LGSGAFGAFLKDLELLEAVKNHEESSEGLSERKLVFQESLLRKRARGKYTQDDAIFVLSRFAHEACSDYLSRCDLDLSESDIDHLCSDLSVLLESEFEYDLCSGALAWMIEDCKLESKLTDFGEPRRRRR